MQRKFKDFFTRDRKALYMIFGMVLISVFSLTIVYAALSVTLNITGSTQITASNWDIHLENPKVKSGSVSASNPSISGNNLSFSVNLTKPGDYYEFTVDVVNDGSIDAMIDSVVKTPELTTEQAKYLKYEVNYQNGETISSKQTLKSGTSTPIKVRVEYRTDLLASDLPTTTANLSLKLTLVYVQSDGSGSEIPNNGVKLVNADGDINEIGTIVTIGSEKFYTIGTEGDNVKLLAMYNLYVGNECTNSIMSSCIAYGEEATGIQESSMLGYALELDLRSGTTAFSNVDGNYSGSIVEGYINDYNSYLITQGVTPIEVRLITVDELTGLGCDTKYVSCSSAPEWVYSTTYWAYKDGVYAYYVSTDSYFQSLEHQNDNQAGVRPVITIAKSYF